MADDLEQLKKNMQTIKKEFDSSKEKMYADLGPKLLESIKARWEKGMGAKGHGADPKKLEALEPKTIRRRELRKLDSRTKPGTSNMIESGDTIESVKQKIVDGSVEIGTETRGDIIRGLEEAPKSRPMLYISKDEEKIIDDVIGAEIDRIFKNL